MSPSSELCVWDSLESFVAAFTIVLLHHSPDLHQVWSWSEKPLHDFSAFSLDPAL